MSQKQFKIEIQLLWKINAKSRVPIEWHYFQYRSMTLKLTFTV